MFPLQIYNQNQKNLILVYLCDMGNEFKNLTEEMDRIKTLSGLIKENDTLSDEIINLLKKQITPNNQVQSVKLVDNRPGKTNKIVNIQNDKVLSIVNEETTINEDMKNILKIAAVCTILATGMVSCTKPDNNVTPIEVVKTPIVLLDSNSLRIFGVRKTYNREFLNPTYNYIFRPYSNADTKTSIVCTDKYHMELNSISSTNVTKLTYSQSIWYFGDPNKSSVVPFIVTWDGSNIVFKLRDTKEIIATFKEVTN
jgi:hypothetical protein